MLTSHLLQPHTYTIFKMSNIIMDKKLMVKNISYLGTIKYDRNISKIIGKL